MWFCTTFFNQIGIYEFDVLVGKGIWGPGIL